MGSIDRARNHKKGSRNYRWWEEMKSNPNYKFIIVDRSLTKQQAWDLEIELIKEFGRRDVDEYGILTNIHPGGSYFGDAAKKAIIQFNLDGYRLNRFDTTTEAAKYMGVDGGNIRRNARGLDRSSRGFQWFYESEVGDIDYIGPVEKDKRYMNGGGHDTSKKMYLHKETGVYCESTREALRLIGSSQGGWQWRKNKDLFIPC